MRADAHRIAPQNALPGRNTARDCQSAPDALAPRQRRAADSGSLRLCTELVERGKQLTLTCTSASSGCEFSGAPLPGAAAGASGCTTWSTVLRISSRWDCGHPRWRRVVSTHVCYPGLARHVCCALWAGRPLLTSVNLLNVPSCSTPSRTGSAGLPGGVAVTVPPAGDGTPAELRRPTAPPPALSARGADVLLLLAVLAVLVRRPRRISSTLRVGRRSPASSSSPPPPFVASVEPRVVCTRHACQWTG